MVDNPRVAPRKIELYIKSLPSKKVQFKKGQLIESENNTPRGIYKLTSGNVKLVIYHKNLQQIIAFLYKNSIIGVNGVLDIKSKMSAYAVDNVELEFIELSAFQDIDDSMISKMTKYYTSYLAHHLKTKILNQSRNNIEEKLITMLLSATPTDKDWLKITRIDIANYVNCSKEHATRTLSFLKKRGIVLSDGHNIKLNHKLTKQKFPNLFS